MTRRSFSTDFKLEAAGLVLDQGYSIPEACKSMGVGPTALRRWVEQLRSERGGMQHHAQGIVQETFAQAEKDEDSGKDVPPEWIVQLGK